MKYRMYIDEVGNSDLQSSGNPNHRYLSLTGVILELEYVRTVAFEKVEGLKSMFFESHPDDPVIFHRKELVNKRFPFEALRNEQVESNFNAALLTVLRNLDFVAMTVVIDKQAHNERYKVWRYDPYHYGLAMLVERYVRWLSRRNSVGDVMAESRGGKEDRRLKASFHGLVENGTNYMTASAIRAQLTSVELKVKTKANNVAGLQIADLIAHPSYAMLRTQRMGEPALETFGGSIAELLCELKYDRSPGGEIEGWGTKWLP